MKIGIKYKKENENQKKLLCIYTQTAKLWNSTSEKAEK